MVRSCLYVYYSDITKLDKNGYIVIESQIADNLDTDVLIECARIRRRRLSVLKWIKNAKFRHATFNVFKGVYTFWEYPKRV